MILNFKYGFQVGNFTYGWLKKELYRLPSISFNRHYPIKKQKKIVVGNQSGYRILRSKYSEKQLAEKTIIINKKIVLIKNNDVPF
ncbi:MAG: hypothetical protein IT275_11230 [Chitinophagales bacterium]|nr:hypothetical protein [Chitinophagales bacterium]